MRQKDVWHLKFRDSEIYIWCHVSEFNLLEAQQAEKVKRISWILPSGRKLPHHWLRNSLSELQSPPWFRSANLGFGWFCGFWFEFWMLASLCSNLWSGILELRLDLECLFRVGFRSGSGVLFLYGLLPILNFVSSWTLVKHGAMPSAFLGDNPNKQD